VSGLAAASRHEDRYGLVLLCDPGLADITSSLLSAVLALQQYSKLTVSPILMCWLLYHVASVNARMLPDTSHTA
jgi:hypothetical protein